MIKRRRSSHFTAHASGRFRCNLPSVSFSCTSSCTSDSSSHARCYSVCCSSGCRKPRRPSTVCSTHMWNFCEASEIPFYNLCARLTCARMLVSFSAGQRHWMWLCEPHIEHMQRKLPYPTCGEGHGQGTLQRSTGAPVSCLCLFPSCSRLGPACSCPEQVGAARML